MPSNTSPPGESMCRSIWELVTCRRSSTNCWAVVPHQPPISSYRYTSAVSESSLASIRYQSVRPCRSCAPGRAVLSTWAPSMLTLEGGITIPSDRCLCERERRYQVVGMLRDTDELLAPAVEEMLAALQSDQVDAAAVRLAQRYARDIDDARLVAASLEPVLREILALDPKIHDRLLSLAVRIERTTVLASLGPKLLAALEQLGATPAARSKTGAGGGDRAGKGQ